MKKFLLLLAVFFAMLTGSSHVLSEPLNNGENFSRIFDEHGAVMLLIDPQSGSIVYGNKAASNFYGYAPEQLLNMKISQINTLSDREIAREMQKAASEQRNYFLFRHRLSNGEIKTVEVFSYPSIYENKQVLFSIVHDVTQKVLLEKRNKIMRFTVLAIILFVILIMSFFISIINKNYKKLKTRSQQIENFNALRQTFIDANDDVIYLKDENLKYIFVNNAFKKFYNVAQEEVIGIDDYALGNKEFAEKRRQTDLAVLKSKALVIDEVRWDDRIYKTTKFPVEMLNGKLGVGAYIKDITEEHRQKKLQEKALARNQILLDAFSNNFETKQEQLDYVLNKALNLTESQFGYIYLYDEHKEEFVINSWSKEVMDECRVMNPQTTYSLDKTGIWGEAVRQRKPIVVNDFNAENPLKKGYPQGHVKLNRFMTIPVIIDRQIVAVVGVANKSAPYDDNDVYELTLLMSGAWNAVERKEALDKLALERKKYLQTLVSIGDGVLVVDKTGNIEMLNNVAEELTGWSIGEARGIHYKEVFALSHESPNVKIKDPIEDVFKTDTVQEMENHAVLTSKSGTKYYLEDSAAPIKDENNTTVGVVLVFRDVTEKKDQRKKIEYLSFHDSLTGLYNRRFFEDELKRLDTGKNLPISIIMGDVNSLKLTNDVFGHTYGDMLLSKVAEVFCRVCRPHDIIARWGGDEFAIILPNTTSNETQEIIDKIKSEFAKEKIKAIKGSISMGFDTKNQPEDDLILILERAEEKMYEVKTVERDENKNAVITDIISTLYSINPREREHADNVSQLSEKLGRALNMSEMEIRRLKDAAYYHDIGKIILNPKLLSKEYPETSIEWKEIKKHPIIGYRILNSFDATLDLAETILAHQEYWDGTGYPKGLKGKEIPKHARIITLIEYYERLIHDWGNAKALTKKQAVSFIKEQAGGYFDPDIARVFVEMLEAE